MEQQFIIDYMIAHGHPVPNSFAEPNVADHIDRKGFELWWEPHFIKSLKYINEEYVSRYVIPFASRKTNDDIVAFLISPSDKGQVIMFHAGTEPGFEGPVYYKTFTDWLESAEDSEEF